MKKLTLTIGERIYATNILNEFKGSLEKLGKALEDVKLVVLSQDEVKEVEYKIVPTTDGKAIIQWNPTKAKEMDKEMELNESTVQYMLDILKVRDDKGEFTLKDEGIIELKSKLE